MPDNGQGMSLAALMQLLPRPDPRGEDYRAHQRRQEQIALYNQMTGADAPLPRPDPRGQNHRDLQIRQEQIDYYNRYIGGR